MKRCSTCQTEYEDTFNVCPRDGTPLGATGKIGGGASTSAVPAAVIGADPMIGTIVGGRYRIVAKLGEGGMGAVYKAEHTKMDRMSAIKILGARMTQDADAIARFNREAQMSSRLDHPHAVMIYDYGESEDGLVFLAMEYIEGHMLSQVIEREGPLSLERTLKIARQVGDALDAAHALGIVHRDLKPDNIMLGRKGKATDFVKVLDFGIAKLAESEDLRHDLTQAGLVIGTPVYMSPEQVAGMKLDPRSDVYSFALIVYEMLSKRLAFDGDNAQAIMTARLLVPPRPLRESNPQVPEQIEAAVMRALVRDRDGRTPSAGQFAHDLEESAARVGPSATSDLPPPSTYPLRQDVSGVATNAMSQPNLAKGAPTSPGSYDTVQGAQATGGAASGTLYPTPPPPGGTVMEAVPSSMPRPTTEPVQAVSAPYGTQQTYPPPPTTPVSGGGAGKWIAIVLVVGFLLLAAAVPIIYFGFIKDSKTAQGTTGTTGTTPPATTGGTAPATTTGGTAPATTTGGTAPATTTTGGTAPATTTGGSTDMVSSGDPEADKFFQEGRALQQQDNNSAAIVAYRKAIEKKSTFPEAHENLAVALLSSGMLTDALNEYQTAISQYPTPKAKTFFGFGYALFKGKKYKEASEAFKRSTEIDPSGKPDAYALCGYALDNLGDKQGANEQFQKYLVLQPTGQHALPIQGIMKGVVKTPTADDI